MNHKLRVTDYVKGKQPTVGFGFFDLQNLGGSILFTCDKPITDEAKLDKIVGKVDLDDPSTLKIGCTMWLFSV